MKQGDYILSAELVREGNGYCLLLEVEDEFTEEVSFTRWHGNLTMADIDVDAIRNSKLKVFSYNSESNVIYAVFDNGYQTISWRCSSPRTEDMIFTD